MAVYAEAERLGMPILIHPSGQFTEQSKLEYGRPYLLDEIARTFPKLRIVIAQLGQPWIDETICMLGKHQHVYADMSGLLMRPWQAYNALVLVHQHGVIDKLLFGSDFPYTSATECIESLYSTNQFAQGTNLPLVPRAALRGIVEAIHWPYLGWNNNYFLRRAREIDCQEDSLLIGRNCRRHLFQRLRRPCWRHHAHVDAHARKVRPGLCRRLPEP